MERLRKETRSRHVRLERDMGLTPYTVTRMNIVRLLGQFHRFYSSWESWIEASPVDRDFFDPRRKLHLIGHDLAALGLAVPRTDHAERIDLGSPSLERAFGSLYVVEGSTLGGQVINRWLEHSPWVPERGLSYFASYGRDVGVMWRRFQTMIGDRVPVSAHDEVVAGAVTTFDQMYFCLCGKEEMA